MFDTAAVGDGERHPDTPSGGGRGIARAAEPTGDVPAEHPAGDAPARRPAGDPSGDRADVVASLPDAGPDLALVAALVDLDADLAALDDHDLLELVTAWRRVSAWAGAAALRAVAELAERESMNPEWPMAVGEVGRPCVAGDELAMRLGLSGRTAERMVRTAQALEGPLWPTAQVMEAGLLDQAKVDVLVSALHDRAGEVALAVQEIVLPEAPSRSPAQLRHDVAAALVRLDPEGADQATTAAVRRRRVARPRPLPDGMAGLWAVLPAPAAMAAWARLDDVARTARTAGDDRTLDQLRADTLSSLLTAGRVSRGGPSGTDGPGSSNGHDLLAGALDAPPRAEIHVTVPLDVLLRPVADPPRPGAARIDPTDEEAHRDGAEAEAGPGTSLSWDVADPPGSGTAPPGSENAPAVGGPAPPSQRPEPVGAWTQEGPEPPLPSGSGGLSAAPVLAGYGPVSPLTAQAIALGGRWRRILTDPQSGTVLDVGTTVYRPPAPLARHVRVRDGECRAPACTVPAERCDLDHTVPFDPDGPTAEGNLGALCRRHHLLKTHGGYRLVQSAPGTFEWLTPTGHRYLRRPPAPWAPWEDGDDALLRRGEAVDLADPQPGARPGGDRAGTVTRDRTVLRPGGAAVEQLAAGPPGLLGRAAPADHTPPPF